MRSTGLIAGCMAGLAMLGTATIVLAHTDDPKGQAVLPPSFDGPIWRRAVEGATGTPGGAMSPAGGFDADGVNLESHVPLGAFDGTHDTANDVWGYVAPSGREYAIIGLRCGSGIVEVTDPANAQIVGTILGACSLWGDVKVFGHYAYKVTDVEATVGVQVIDLSDVDNGNVTLANTFSGETFCHNIVIDEASGFLYCVGGTPYGFAVFDLNADAENPPLVGQWADRYIHDAQVVTYTEGPYAGRQIMFACSGDNGGWSDARLEILDVTNKASVFTTGQEFYSNAFYSHQGWLSEDRQHFYLDDELDEAQSGNLTTTRIFDVSDLSNPTEAGTFTNGLATIDHNLYVRGSLIFAANYTSGLRVFDAADPLAPVEIAYFDTRPEGNETDFFGLWSNYPLLPSGTVLGSDEQRGLFVWSVDALSGACADLDASGVVDIGDLLAILTAWGNPGGPEDLDDSGVVDFGDILIVLAQWGSLCP